MEVTKDIKINIQMNAEVKKQFEEFCKKMGISMSTAFNLFAKKTITEERLPFEISVESNENKILTLEQIKYYVKTLFEKYNIEKAILFGSYARNEATPESDIDIIIIGNNNFEVFDIFAIGEELRTLTGKKVDAYEISEINKNSDIYISIMKEGVEIK